MKPIRNVHFSFPCNEKIAGMEFLSQGKYCSTCSKTLIDFREKDEHLLLKMLQKDEKVCGIFSEKQVASGYEAYKQLAAAAILSLAISLPGNSAQAQTTFANKPVDTTEFIYVGKIAGTSASYKHGNWKDMLAFIQENIRYPADSAEGKTVVRFIVDTNGHVCTIQLRKSISELADREIIRVLKLLEFNPATHGSQKVNDVIYLPFTFSRNKKTGEN